MDSHGKMGGDGWKILERRGLRTLEMATDLLSLQLIYPLMCDVTLLTTTVSALSIPSKLNI